MFSIHQPIYLAPSLSCFPQQQRGRQADLSVAGSTLTYFPVMCVWQSCKSSCFLKNISKLYNDTRTSISILTSLPHPVITLKTNKFIRSKAMMNWSSVGSGSKRLHVNNQEYLSHENSHKWRQVYYLSMQSAWYPAWYPNH